MIPIPITEADLMARIAARNNGTLDEWKSSNTVKEPPKAFYNWIEKNKERIVEAGKRGTLPYWIRDNEKYFVSLQKNNTNNSGITMPTNKPRIRELRDWAKENIQGKVIKHPLFNKEIHITGKGIDEYLNQPHIHYYEKNELIKDIENVIVGAFYVGNSDYKASKVLIASHIFEIEIKKDKSWLIVHEYNNNDVNFYSISDNEKILMNIKKIVTESRSSEIQSNTDTFGN
jgi:hypothetical protein